MKKIATTLGLITSISVFLVAQSRVVLVEQFTNAGCPPCAASSPSVFSFVETNENDVVAIAYHTSFPYNDSLYFENPGESDARVAYYSVAGVPYSIVDGNYYENSSSTFLQSISSTINTRKAVSAGYSIDSLLLSLIGNQLTGSFKFTALSNHSSDSLIAHIVVIEKNVLKSSYTLSPGANNETEYGYVMRKMLPDQNGTVLVNTALGGSDTINVSCQLNKIKDLNQVKIIVFVQNHTTKEVYQADLFSPEMLPTGIESKNRSGCKPVIYPNPANNYLNIWFECRQMVSYIKIFNSQGKMVRSFTVNDEIESFSQNLDLQSGLYNISVEGVKSAHDKLLIMR